MRDLIITSACSDAPKRDAQLGFTGNINLLQKLHSRYSLSQLPRVSDSLNYRSRNVQLSNLCMKKLSRTDQDSKSGLTSLASCRFDRRFALLSLELIFSVPIADAPDENANLEYVDFFADANR